MTDDRIAKRAYEIWEGEGRPHGRHPEHWQKAMAELATPKPATASKVRVTPPKKKAAPVVVKTAKKK